LNIRPRIPETRCLRSTLTFLHRIGTSCYRDSCHYTFGVPTPEIRNAEVPITRYLASRFLAPREINLTTLLLPRPDVPRWLATSPAYDPRSYQLGASPLAISTCMQFLHLPTPRCQYAMVNEFCLRLKVQTPPKVQVVDSLPFEEFFAPKLLPFGTSPGSVPQYL
jgi:hypothetical protein